MERAFEDMYLAATDLQGDLTLALDPHPPPSHTTDADLELSVNEEEEVVAPSVDTEGTTDRKQVLGDSTGVDRSKLINKDKTPGERD